MLNIIAIGNKARQGKDYTANLIQGMVDREVFIIHWADALYEEVKNPKRKHPLFYKNADTVYIFTPNGKIEAELKLNDVPELRKIIFERGIKIYWGMNEKDSPMLQFWGTNFRRKQDSEYWVKKCLERIKEIQSQNPDALIIIPDTRFQNEYRAIKELGGIFLRVKRLNPDNTLFFAADRDPNHPSEKDLDNTPADYEIICQSGELDQLENKVIEFIKHINLKVKLETIQ